VLVALATLLTTLVGFSPPADANIDPPPDPTQIGFATLSNIAINGEPGTMAAVEPGAAVEITADYSVDHTLSDGTVYCPGCIDHIPMAFQGFGTQPMNEFPGSPELCLGPGGGNSVYHGSSGTGTVAVGNVPDEPGLYHVIAQFEFTYWCGQYWNPESGTIIASVFVPPTEKADCTDGAWEAFDGLFPNQGDCIAYVNTDGANPPGVDDDDNDDDDNDDDDDDDDDGEEPT
jgi:hypothetical protein